VAGGTEGETLLEVFDQLCAALGYAGGEVAPGDTRPILGGREPSRDAGLLSPEDERLVVSVRNGLAKVAAAVGAGRAAGTPERAVGVALEGAELVMRGELACGRAAQLAGLMPSFVFLVTLPIVDQDEAIELSRRTSALLEGALGG
jgi:hypothetical protein